MEETSKRVFTLILYTYCIWDINAASISSTTSQGITLDVTLTCNSSECQTYAPEPECHEICGCDKTYKYDEEKKQCVIDINYLRQLSASKTYVSTDNDLTDEDALATKIRERVDRVFGGIIVAVIFFIVCAAVCILSVFAYCCHIRYSDRKMKNELNTLSQKLKINPKKNKASMMRKKPSDEIGESCNVVVPDANIMCM